MNKLDKSKFKLETDLICLRSLVAVVEEGGFSAAAKRIHRTQSAISLQIAKLEERLNTKLLERTSRSIAVTPSGETFLSYARRILELADEAVLSVTAPKEATRLRIGFMQYLASQHLHILLARFRRAHPNCDLSLAFGGAEGVALLERMDRGELDVVFAGPITERGGAATALGPARADRSRVLWEEPLVWAGNMNRSNDPAAPIDLILLSPPCSFRQIAFEALTKIGTPWRLSIDANSVLGIQSAIRAGLGISVLPLSAIVEGMPINEGDLPELPRTSVISYTSADQSHPYVHRFIDFLLERMKDSFKVNKDVSFGERNAVPEL